MDKMKRGDFLNLVAEALETSRSEAKQVLDKIEEVVIKGMKEGTSVPLFKSVWFFVKDVGETERRNPATGETILIPAKKTPKVKLSKVFKDYFME